MNKPILIILLQFFSSLLLMAQQGVQLPEVQQMVPRKSDEKALFYDVQVHPQGSIISTTIQIREIDLTLPEHKALDSIFDWRGESSTFVEFVFNMALRKKVKAYSDVTYVNLEKAELPPQTTRNIIESTNADSCSKILILEKSMLDKEHSQRIFEILAIAPAININGEHKPIFWIRFGAIQMFFQRYEVINNKGTKVALNDFIRGCYISSRVTEVAPLPK